MKKGFATSAILYTILLLFLVLMVGILNNLQSKKTILDQLKMETIQAIESSNGTCYELQEKIDQLQEKLELLKGQGDATSEEILEGKTAVVQGNLVTGTLKTSDVSSVAYKTVDASCNNNIGQNRYQITSNGGVKFVIMLTDYIAGTYAGGDYNYVHLVADGQILYNSNVNARRSMEYFDISQYQDVYVEVSSRHSTSATTQSAFLVSQ